MRFAWWLPVVMLLVMLHVGLSLSAFEEAHGFPLSSDIGRPEGYLSAQSLEFYAPVVPFLLQVMNYRALVCWSMILLLLSVYFLGGGWAVLFFLSFGYYAVFSQVVFGGNVAQALAEVLMFGLFAFVDKRWSLAFVLLALPVHKFGFFVLLFAWVLANVSRSALLFPGLLAYGEQLVQLPKEILNALSLRVALSLPVWFFGLLGLRHFSEQQRLIVLAVFLSAFFGLAVGQSPERVLAPVTILLLVPAGVALSKGSKLLKWSMAIALGGFVLFAIVQVQNDLGFYISAFQGP